MTLPDPQAPKAEWRAWAKARLEEFKTVGPAPVLAAIEAGYPQAEIADAAYR